LRNTVLNFKNRGCFGTAVARKIRPRLSGRVIYQQAQGLLSIIIKWAKVDVTLSLNFIGNRVDYPNGGHFKIYSF
jgi:regulator of sigma D